MPSIFARSLALSCLAALCGCTTVLKPADPEMGLDWMAGAWADKREDRLVEEHWIQPGGGTMLGVNRTVSDGKTAFFEYLRIERTEEGIVLKASPLGRTPTPFTMIEQSDRRIVFENPDHDFPQRIIYWRLNDALHARIEGTQGGEEQATEWRMQRARMEVR